jgi:hypothetical protein
MSHKKGNEGFSKAISEEDTDNVIYDCDNNQSQSQSQGEGDIFEIVGKSLSDEEMINQLLELTKFRNDDAFRRKQLESDLLKKDELLVQTMNALATEKQNSKELYIKMQSALNFSSKCEKSLTAILQENKQMKQENEDIKGQLYQARQEETFMGKKIESLSNENETLRNEASKFQSIMNYIQTIDGNESFTKNLKTSSRDKENVNVNESIGSVGNMKGIRRYSTSINDDK